MSPLDPKAQKAILPYDIDALRANIDRHDANIKLFEDQIEKEQAEKRRLRQMISVLEAKRDGED